MPQEPNPTIVWCRGRERRLSHRAQEVRVLRVSEVAELVVFEELAWEIREMRDFAMISASDLALSLNIWRGSGERGRGAKSRDPNRFFGERFDRGAHGGKQRPQSCEREHQQDYGYQSG